MRWENWWWRCYKIKKIKPHRSAFSWEVGGCCQKNYRKLNILPTEYCRFFRSLILISGRVFCCIRKGTYPSFATFTHQQQYPATRQHATNPARQYNLVSTPNSSQPHLFHHVSIMYVSIGAKNRAETFLNFFENNCLRTSQQLRLEGKWVSMPKFSYV